MSLRNVGLYPTQETGSLIAKGTGVTVSRWLWLFLEQLRKDAVSRDTMLGR
jgi:hypothetical protein